MRGNKIACLAFLMTGCAASFVKSELDDPTIKTIGRETGSMATDGLYQTSFEKEAERQCPNGYMVVERSRHPSTLAKIGVQESSRQFYWVIKCK